MDSPIRGILLKCFSVLVFTVMAAIVKATSDGGLGVPPGQQVFFRSFFAIPVIILWLVWRGPAEQRVVTPAWHLHFVGFIIGGLSAVHQFSRIGRHAFVGGMTGISQDLPPYMMAVGSRAGIHGPNLVGLRRLGLGSAVVTAVRSAFRLIWLSELPRQEALDKAAGEYSGVPEVMELVSFVRESPRGVLPVAKSVDVKD